jgi:hypothetical protein
MCSPSLAEESRFLYVKIGPKRGNRGEKEVPEHSFYYTLLVKASYMGNLDSRIDETDFTF